VLAKILAVLVLIPYESHGKLRQDSISVEMKDVNTFVRTPWTQGGAPIPRHRMWVRVPEVLARPKAREPWFASYLQTYLERDVRAIMNVRDLVT